MKTMKPLNKTQALWSNTSPKEVEGTKYISTCCFNIRIQRFLTDK